MSIAAPLYWLLLLFFLQYINIVQPESEDDNNEVTDENKSGNDVEDEADQKNADDVTKVSEDKGNNDDGEDDNGDDEKNGSLCCPDWPEISLVVPKVTECRNGSSAENTTKYMQQFVINQILNPDVPIVQQIVLKLKTPMIFIQCIFRKQKLVCPDWNNNPSTGYCESIKTVLSLCNIFNSTTSQIPSSNTNPLSNIGRSTSSFNPTKNKEITMVPSNIATKKSPVEITTPTPATIKKTEYKYPPPTNTMGCNVSCPAYPCLVDANYSQALDLCCKMKMKLLSLQTKEKQLCFAKTSQVTSEVWTSGARGCGSSASWTWCATNEAFTSDVRWISTAPSMTSQYSRCSTSGPAGISESSCDSKMFFVCEWYIDVATEMTRVWRCRTVTTAMDAECLLDLYSPELSSYALLQSLQ
ncbi:hypothetical protein B566_EDAN011794 [Ephemera danica]|nr:hypothetical protein B566_EDAN011794 [Ephemera danica]